MGVTAIWISPTVDNENLNINSGAYPFPHPITATMRATLCAWKSIFGDPANSWTAFDNLVTAAHQNGIKVIVDWANNHSNYNGGGRAVRFTTTACSWPQR
jgi:glycosidase